MWQIHIPATDTRFAQGAAAFGMLMSAYGGGNLLGVILAGALPKPAPKRMGMLLLAVMSVQGIGLLVLGMPAAVAVPIPVRLVMGTANGFVSFLFLARLQAHTAQSMMGRLTTLYTAEPLMESVVFSASLNRNVRRMGNSSDLPVSCPVMFSARRPVGESMALYRSDFPDGSCTIIFINLFSLSGSGGGLALFRFFLVHLNLICGNVPIHGSSMCLLSAPGGHR